jgi:hypothetical protein
MHSLAENLIFWVPLSGARLRIDFFRKVMMSQEGFPETAEAPGPYYLYMLPVVEMFIVFTVALRMLIFCSTLSSCPHSVSRFGAMLMLRSLIWTLRCFVADFYDEAYFILKGCTTNCFTCLSLFDWGLCCGGTNRLIAVSSQVMLAVALCPLPSSAMLVAENCNLGAAS